MATSKTSNDRARGTNRHRRGGHIFCFIFNTIESIYKAKSRTYLAFAVLSFAVWDAAAIEVIAHRGASGYLPEHTIASYALAYGQGSHWIEPDVVLTRDGVPVAHHDITLERTTDVADRFPHRKRSDGRFYVGDFTVAEIKQLAVLESREGRYPSAFQSHRIPTLEEVLELVTGLNASTGCRVGIYVELKYPQQQPRLTDEVMALLSRYPIPKLIQSFDRPTLESLVSSVTKVQLVPADPVLTAGELDRIAQYANGVGVPTVMVYENPDVVGWAQARGMAVHAYTLRADRLSEGFETFEDEAATLAGLGIDGVFTDHPDRAVEVFETTRFCR